MPPKATTKSPNFELDKLGRENFDAWERQLKHALWAADCYAYFEAKGDDAQEVKSIPEELQRLIWGGITKSLDAHMTAKIDNVKMGNVVELLKTIRKQYYRETVATKSQLRERLHNIQLSDFKDIDDYIAARSKKWF